MHLLDVVGQPVNLARNKEKAYWSDVVPLRWFHGDARAESKLLDQAQWSSLKACDDVRLHQELLRYHLLRVIGELVNNEPSDKKTHLAAMIVVARVKT